MNSALQDLQANEIVARADSHDQQWAFLEKLGTHVSRYGLVLTLLLIGALKFTSGEAQGIQPLVANSPLMSWLYRFFSMQTVSNLIGVTELAVALLIALRPVSAKLSFIGSLGATITFLLTLSFLFSTPDAFHWSHGFPVLGDTGQFLIKDLVLLGVSIWTAAEALHERSLFSEPD
jgi:uncharacterized membrane protein YkgB